MNRRGFFGVIAGAFAAAVVPWRKSTPTIGAIDNATFSFWRNSDGPKAYDNLSASMRDLYDKCEPLDVTRSDVYGSAEYVWQEYSFSYEAREL